MSEEELKQAVAAARKRGEKVVMTNGVFDILHAGHVSYLANARKLGDRLIVAVNSDASTKRLKGETRLVNPLEQRMIVLGRWKPSTGWSPSKKIPAAPDRWHPAGSAGQGRRLQTGADRRQRRGLGERWRSAGAQL